MPIQYAFLIPILAIASWTDLRQRKIHNALLLPSLLLALAANTILAGMDGLKASLLGCLVGFILLLIPYLMGGIGAGDVKLLMVIGAFGGLSFVVISFIIGALLGGACSLLLLGYRKFLFHHIATIPYGIFLGLGALLNLYLLYGGA